MIPGMNPRKMQGMMKKMGISQVDIPATEVIIKQEDKELIISEPQVAKVSMMGQETYQITGTIRERQLEPAKHEILDEDITTVVEQTGVSKEEAKTALEAHNGDLAAAILELQK